MDTPSSNGILEEFRLQFQKCWEALPNKPAFFGLLGAWVLLFQLLGNSFGYYHSASLFGYLYSAHAPAGYGVFEAEESYAFLVPFVVLFLFWRKRELLTAGELRNWWPAVFIVAAGASLHIIGYCLQQPRISVLGFFVGVYGLMGLAWGPRFLRQSVFPFFLFAFCIPIGALAEPVTFRLRLLVCQLVGFISHYLLAIDVIVQGNMLIDPSGHYQYEVAAACSGIRSLTATFAFAVILAFSSFDSVWKRLALIAAAIPLAVLGNMVRMLTIVIAAEMGGQKWGSYIHEGGPGGIFSLLPYVPAFIGLLALERYLRCPQKSDPVPPSPLALERV